MSDHNCSMKVTFLGYHGTFPKAGPATSCVLVETDQGAVLLDCGSGSLAQFFRFCDIPQLKGVLISHLHYDHMGDLGCLQYAINHSVRTGARADKVAVYAPATPTAMWDAIQYPLTDSIVLEDGMTFELIGIKITVKKVKHTIECYSFRLEKDGKTVVYFTDTEYIPDGADFIRGADLFIGDAITSVGTVHSTGIGHMSDLEAGRIAREGEVKTLCLFHLPSDGDVPLMRERAASEFNGTVMTPDQQRVFLL